MVVRSPPPPRPSSRPCSAFFEGGVGGQRPRRHLADCIGSEQLVLALATVGALRSVSFALGRQALGSVGGPFLPIWVGPGVAGGGALCVALPQVCWRAAARLPEVGAAFAEGLSRPVGGARIARAAVDQRKQRRTLQQALRPPCM